MQALERAVKAIGSEAALALAIDVATNTPAMWKLRGKVPSRHGPSIEFAVRPVAEEKGMEPVTCEQLCPGVRWVRIPADGWPNGKPLQDNMPAAQPSEPTAAAGA